MSLNPTSTSGSLVPPAGWAGPLDHESAPISPAYLLLVTVLGAALRLYGLTAQSLWVDEILSWHMIRPGVPVGYLEQVLDSIQGPLYTAVAWPLVGLRESALMLRLPAAVAGIVTIPLFGILANRLAGGKVARLAVLLLALNPFHVWYSQEGRGYAFLMLFSVLMGLAYLRLNGKDYRYSSALLFALSAAGAAWSNLSGMFLWAAMGMSILMFDFPRSRRGWMVVAGAFGVALLLVSPWLLKASGIWAVDRMVPGSVTGEALRGETTFSPLAWPYTIQTFFYGYSFGPCLRELHQPDLPTVLRGFWPLLLMGFLPLAAGFGGSLFHFDRRRARLLVWTLVPVLVVTFLAVRNVKPWNPRYVSMVFPWVLILVAWGLGNLPRRWGLAAFLLLIGLTLWSLGGYYGDGRYAKADVRAAAAHLEGVNADGDVMIVPVVTSVFKFYYQGPGDIVNTSELPVLKSSQEAADFLGAALAGRDHAWVVLAREWYLDPDGHLPVALARSGHLRLAMTGPGVRVMEWTRKESDVDQP